MAAGWPQGPVLVTFKGDWAIVIIARRLDRELYGRDTAHGLKLGGVCGLALPP
jgi:hypothetical protein